MKNQEIKQIQKAARAHERKRWAKKIDTYTRMVSDVDAVGALAVTLALTKVIMAIENNKNIS